MSNSGFSPAASIVGKRPTKDKNRVVPMRRRVPTNWISGRKLQPSTEPAIASFSVLSDFFVERHVSGLGNEHPLLTSSFFCTWCDVVS